MKRIDQIVRQWKGYFISPTLDKETETDVNTFIEKYPSLKELFLEIEDNERLGEAIKLYNSLSYDASEQANNPVLAKILDRIQDTSESPRVHILRRLSYWLVGVAACAILVTGTVWLQHCRSVEQRDIMELASNMLPRRDGATLSMSDGRNVQLTSEESG